LKLSSRISVLSGAAEGDPLAGGRTSPQRIAGYGHSAAIETILARGCSTARAIEPSRAVPRHLVCEAAQAR
jgi:hypothetical protein